MVNVFEQTPNMFAQGVIHNQRRSLFCQADAFRLFQYITHPPVVDLCLRPAVAGEVSRDVRLIGTLDRAQSNIGHALVGQHHQPWQTVLRVPKLTTVREQITKQRGLASHQWRWLDNWQLHLLLST